MRSLLWLLALIMLFGWGLGFFVWAAPSFIHLFLVVGIVLVIYNVLVPNNRAKV